MLKKIKNYFKSKISERRRKNISDKLPADSFLKKLFSNKDLHKEVILLKIGNEVIDISLIRDIDRTFVNGNKLHELGKKYDLSKATIIHQHIIEGIRKEGSFQFILVGKVDYFSFLGEYRHCKIRYNAVILLDTKLNPIGEVVYEITPQLQKKIDQMSSEEFKIFQRNITDRNYNDVVNLQENIKRNEQYLRELGIKRKTVCAPGYRIRGDVIIKSKLFN